MSEFERSIIGWQTIADFLERPLWWVMERSKELRGCGVVFPRIHRDPSTGFRVKRMHAFPSELRRWQRKRYELDEIERRERREKNRPL